MQLGEDGECVNGDGVGGEESEEVKRAKMLEVEAVRAAEGGSDRSKGVYQAIEHEPLAGDDTKKGVETSRGDQATLSAPKYHTSRCAQAATCGE